VRSVRRFGAGGGRAGVDLRERAAGGLRRRRWNLQKHFHVGDQQVVNLGRHLCLVGGDLLDDLPQRGEVYGYLLHLLGVEQRGGPFRRDPIHSQPSRRPTLNTLLRGDVITGGGALPLPMYCAQPAMLSSFVIGKRNKSTECR
jgi:hypothetical protein